MSIRGFISLDGALSKVWSKHQSIVPPLLFDVTNTTLRPTSISVRPQSFPINDRPNIYEEDVNRHPLTPCPLHRKIDDEFSNSSFAKHVRFPIIRLRQWANSLFRHLMNQARLVCLHLVRTLTVQTVVIGWWIHSATRRTLRKWDKKPVYVLDLTIPIEDVDNLLEPAKATVQFRVCPSTILRQSEMLIKRISRTGIL